MIPVRAAFGTTPTLDRRRFLCRAAGCCAVGFPAVVTPAETPPSKALIGYTELRTDLPGDELGTVGVVDETGTRKKGTKTPGVRRQWFGELGKVENCVVTVHLAVAKGRSKTLVDGELFLPESWDQDRYRCHEAGIPEEVVYRPKWRIALREVLRARALGIGLDWLTFDEDYGSKPGFLRGLDEQGLPDVGEVPKAFRCFTAPPGAGQKSHRADDLVRHSPAFHTQPWQTFRLARQTVGEPVWRAKAARQSRRRRRCGLPLVYEQPSQRSGRPRRRSRRPGSKPP